MTTSTTARLLTAATTAVLLSVPGAASAQDADCVEVAPGTSAAGTPTECPTEADVLGEVIERENDPAPDPEAAPELAATGFDSGDLALVALGAIGAGGALTMVARRRRETT